MVVPALVDGHFVALPIEQVVELFKKGHDVRVLAPHSGSPRSFRKVPRFVRVLGVKEYEYNGQLVRIVTHYGREVIVTPNHVIPIFRGCCLRFVPASEIREGDRIITDFELEIPHGNEVALVGTEVAELLGYVLSEGSNVNHYSKLYKDKWYLYNTVLITNYDSRIQERVKQLVKDLGTWAYARPKRPSQIRLSPKVMEAFKVLGLEKVEKSSMKSIPMKVFWLPREHLRAFLRALYSGDGCVKTERGGKGAVVDYATKSVILAQQLYWLLRYLGFKYIRVEHDSGLYRLQLGVKEDIEWFLRYVGFIQEEKNEELKNAIEEGKVASAPRLRKTAPVKKVGYIEYSGKVYDLAVENPHLYFAGFGAVVHNSYWRLLGRYRRGRPFFSVYEIVDSELKPVRDRQRWVLENIVASAMAHDIVPPEAKAYIYRVYRRLYGPLTR